MCACVYICACTHVHVRVRVCRSITFVNVTSFGNFELQVSRDAGVNEQLNELAVGLSSKERKRHKDKDKRTKTKGQGHRRTRKYHEEFGDEIDVPLAATAQRRRRRTSLEQLEDLVKGGLL